MDIAVTQAVAEEAVLVVHVDRERGVVVMYVYAGDNPRFHTENYAAVRRALGTPCSCCDGDCTNGDGVVLRGRGFYVDSADRVLEVVHGFHMLVGCFYMP